MNKWTLGVGTTIGRWYVDVPQSRPLFSGQAALLSLPNSMHHSSAPIFNFYKKIAFLALFLAKISAPKRQNFWIFTLKTHRFSRKTCSLNPIFGNPCGTYPPNKVECPPRGGDCHLTNVYGAGRVLTPISGQEVNVLSLCVLILHRN